MTFQEYFDASDEYRGYKKSEIKQLDVSSQDLHGTADLKEFTSLTHVDISNNRIKELINIPITLVQLDVSINLLKTIKLPDGLKTLDLGETRIVLDKLPPKLVSLSIIENKAFKIMPSLPKTIKYIAAQRSGLEDFMDFPMDVELIPYTKESQSYFIDTPIEKRLYLTRDFDTWKKIQLNCHLKQGDALRGAASISDTGLFDFKN